MSLDQFLLSSDTTDLNYPEVRPTLDLNFARVKALDPRITFTRASGGSYVGADGLIKLAGVNEPRFDHDPVTGESLGLLIEESRTNYVSYSQNFSTYWSAECLIQSNVAIAPDGTFTATKLIANTNSVVLPFYYGHQIYRTVTTLSGYCTWSLYAKAGECDSLNIIANATQGYLRQVVFNLKTGTYVFITGNASNTSVIFKNVGNGWYLCSVTPNNMSGFTSSYITFNIQIFNTTPININIDGIYIWGAQLEAGAFPTSYIPTEGSSRTRAAESASITGKNFRDFYRQDEGTLYLKTKSLASTSAPNRRLLFLSSSSSNDTYAVELNFAYYSDHIIASRRGLNANVSLMLNNPTKVSFAWNMTGSALSVDGQSVNFTSGTSTQRTFDVLQFGYVTYPSPDGTAGNIYMERITYYPKRLTDAQLQVLTR
jgi:hypothetical protein